MARTSGTLGKRKNIILRIAEILLDQQLQLVVTKFFHLGATVVVPIARVFHIQASLALAVVCKGIGPLSHLCHIILHFANILFRRDRKEFVLQPGQNLLGVISRSFWMAPNFF